MANLNMTPIVVENKKAILDRKILDVFIPSFLDGVIDAEFDGDRPYDYHDENRVKARMGKWLKNILQNKPLSVVLDILEDEQGDCYDSGEGWQGDVALALQASIMMRLKIFDARHSTGVERKRHIKSARQWREAIRYAGL